MLQGSGTPYYPSPELINQYCDFHLGVVKSCADPQKRGRVCVEVPGLLSTGKSNWTCWIEIGGNPIGSNKGAGDEGIWWTPQVGQVVLVGFIAGDPFVLWGINGPPCGDEGKPMIPAEPKSYEDARKATRCKIFKSESGHSLIMDDNGKSELFASLSWTGAGLALVEPGKEEDDKEQPREESKPRKGERRETKNIWEGSSKKPSELLEGGKSYTALTDLNANGLYMLGDDKKGGMVALGARKSPDKDPSASIVLDAENNLIALTAGETQLLIFGKTGDPLTENKIFVTRQMVVKIEKLKIKEYFSKIKEAIGKRFKAFSGS